jgi:uncharacterized protein YjiS (DUF1127 family)
MRCGGEPLLRRADQSASRQPKPPAEWKMTMLISLIRMVRDYLRKRAAYAEIAQLDERTLRDIGLARHQLPSRW